MRERQTLQWICNRTPSAPSPKTAEKQATIATGANRTRGYTPALPMQNVLKVLQLEPGALVETHRRQ